MTHALLALGQHLMLIVGNAVAAAALTALTQTA